MTVKRVSLGGSGLAVPNIALGLMRIQDLTDQEVRALVGTAIDLGVDFFDHADVYGSTPHGCERRFGEALGWTSTQREQVQLQSKCGIVKDGPYYDFSASHIVESVEGTLAALQTDYLDVLLLHRPDALVEPEEVARAFDALQAAGKVRSFGVSNHTPGQMELLRRFVRQPLAANQVQFSLAHANLVAQGISANMGDLPQSVDRDNGILDYCRLHGITIQAWSPFQAGFFGGTFLSSAKYPELNAELDRLAAEYDVTPVAIAAAWITRHPARMQVVLGTTNPKHLVEAAAGSQVPLTAQQWYGLFRAAGHTVP